VVYALDYRNELLSISSGAPEKELRSLWESAHICENDPPETSLATLRGITALSMASNLVHGRGGPNTISNGPEINNALSGIESHYQGTASRY
jgi:hypothetical protein